jgi:WD40 repeat protein
MVPTTTTRPAKRQKRVTTTQHLPCPRTTAETAGSQSSTLAPFLPFSLLVEHVVPCLQVDDRHTVASLHSDLYDECQHNLPPWPTTSLPQWCPLKQVRSVAVSPPCKTGGVWVAGGCKDGTIQLWHSSSSTTTTTNGGQRRVLHHNHKDPVFHVVFSPTRPYQLVSASWGRDRRPDDIYVWDLRSDPPHVAQLGPFLAVEGPTFPVVFSPHGHFLATAGYHLNIWSMMDNFDTEQLNGTLTRVQSWVGDGGGGGGTTSSSSSTTIHRVTTARTPTFAGRRDAVDGVEDDYDEDDALLDSHPEYTCLSFSPEIQGSRYLATSCAWETGVRLWDLQSNKEDDHGNVGSEEDEEDAVLLQGQRRPAPSSLRLTSQFPIDQVSFSPQMIVSKTCDGSGTTTATTATTRSEPQYLLATAGPDCCIRIWKIPHGTCERVIFNYGIRLSTLSFHPDGQVVMAGDCETSLMFWNIKDGSLVNGLSCLPLGIRAASWSSSSSTSSLNASSTTSCTAFPTGMSTLSGNQPPVDTTLLVTASRDGTIRLWDICLTRQRLEEARRHVTKILSSASVAVATTLTSKTNTSDL